MPEVEFEYDPSVEGISAYYADGTMRCAAMVLMDDASDEQAHAEGYLMAAAPLLLEALRELVASPNNHRPERVWDAARAAIKAAEGE